MKWKIQHEGQELSKPKVCLAFKLGTSNEHMDHRDQLHSRIRENNSYLLNTTLSTTNLSKIRIDESWPNLRVECSRDKISFQSYSRHYVTIYRRQISRIPFLIHQSLWNRSVQLNFEQMNERTNETKPILWPAMNRYHRERTAWHFIRPRSNMGSSNE